MLSAPVPVHNDVRIDSNRRVIDEHLAIHLADIDRTVHAARNDRDRILDGKRNSKILGEVIQRSQRNDAERNIRTGDRTRDRMDGTVSPAGDNGVDLASGGPFYGTLGGGLELGTCYKFKAGRDRMLAKGGFKLRTQIIALFLLGAAGGGVQQDADAFGFQGVASQRSAGTSNRDTS